MNTGPEIWLRAEYKPGEARAALSPSDAGTLISRGFRICVEESAQRVFPAADYAAAGCRIASAGEWRQAPGEALILGLKELPVETAPLTHRHIYFAHAYKGQRGWQSLLARFNSGGGRLLDLEYLVDDSGRRVAAFGYWAGFIGAALAVMTWAGQRADRTPPLAPLAPWPDRQALIAAAREALEPDVAGSAAGPRIIVVGALGRVGRGALDLAAELELAATPWDLAETAAGGPFPELLEHDVFVNCVLVTQPIPPFIDRASIASPARSLRVVADVSCDPYGEHNPVPLYNECTSLTAPSLRLPDTQPPLDLIAIDHLPSLLPRESSEDFSEQLTPALMELAATRSRIWERAGALFQQHASNLG